MLDYDTNIIFVGDKQFMSYITAVSLQFSKGEKEVILKARGKFTARAIDVAESSSKQFIENILVKSVIIGSENMTREGKNIRVSSIEIRLVKQC